jgi:curved DNA-binding protein CbpA
MVTDPLEVLGVSSDASEEKIRHRYLDLVRQHPPEQDPQGFARVREAYDMLREPIQRVERQLFGENRTVTMEEFLNQLLPDLRETRLPTDVLLSLGNL